MSGDDAAYPRGRALGRWLLSAFFVAAGANHFLNPDFYDAQLPPWLPWPQAMLAISGVAEIAGGVGLLLPRFQRAAGIGLVVLLLAIFPANIHAALHGMPNIPTWVVWVRLPFQPLMIWLVWCAAITPTRTDLTPR